MPIYLDNASTSYPKPKEVAEAICVYLKDIGGVPGTGYSSRQSSSSWEMVNECRGLVAKMVGAQSTENIFFTYGACDALNKIVFASIEPGDRVVICDGDPRPVTSLAGELEQKGVTSLHLPFDKDNGVNVKQLERALQKSKMLILSHASNITGSIIPETTIGKLCEQYGVFFALDCSHTIGALPIDVQTSLPDALVFSGHKHLFGPTGIGCAYVSQALSERIQRLSKTGRTTKEVIEPCTLNMVGISGLFAGVKFVLEEGVERVRQHHKSLRESLIGALEMCKKVKILAPDVEDGAGIVSFASQDLPTNTMARLLEERYGLVLGNGTFLSDGAAKSLGVYPLGCLRASIGFFNTISDVEYLATSLSRMLGGR